MKTRIKMHNIEIMELLGAQPVEFPKYAKQIINLANQNSQGTRPRVVGQMTELIQEFSGQSIEEWEKWYLERYPDAIKKATLKISGMVDNLKSVIIEIDEKMIEKWVKDLLIIKTFIGLKFQKAILSKTAELLQTTYTLSTKEEESQGIDGYVGNMPVSIKPESYRAKRDLLEKIEAKFIYYKKAKDGITIDIEELVA